MVTTAWIKGLMKSGELWRFYKTPEWIRLKNSILKENHYECAECKKRGVIKRYDIDHNGEKHLLSTVHHVCHVRSHPELALSRVYKDHSTGETKPNLIPLCKACHNRAHPEKSRRRKNVIGFTNEERW